MNPRDPDQDRSAGGLWRRWGGVVIGVLLLVLVAAMLWYLLSGTASTRREMPSTPMLMLPPPPPPPPPPEPEQVEEPEPEDVVEPEPIEPLEQPIEDTPPDPSEDLNDPMTIDGEADAGTDAFGAMRSSGGGMSGTGGVGGIAYSRYLSNALQRAFERDDRTRRLSFKDIRLDIWLDTDGRVTRAQLVSGTGDQRTDDAVMSMVREFRSDEPPPPSFRFPMRMSIDGRRP